MLHISASFKNPRNLLILFLLLLTVGCTTGKGRSLIAEPQQPAIEESFSLGSAAYQQGDLDQAEREFRKVLTRQPRHARATYNMSMLYLRRAYDGLTHYVSIEPDSLHRQQAQAMLLGLDALDN